MTESATSVGTNPYRALLPDLPAYACRNCGHWQRWPAPGPLVCPVCADFRNGLPGDGFEFWTTDQIDAIVTGFRRPTAVDGVTEFGTEPRVGLDSRGWVIESDRGLVCFEFPPRYTPDMLDHLRAMSDTAGGIRALATSHVHGYGALWQLQQELDPQTVCVGVRDLEWTKAFRVTWPVDDELELATDLTLHRSGGHFEGHLLLHDRRRRVLFCGDLLKADLDSDGNPVALSAHMAFHAQIPLSHALVRQYRGLVESLEFDTIATPFELVPNVTTEHVLRLFERLLSGPPQAAPISMEELS